jgi:putative DNA primase/helicase
MAPRGRAAAGREDSSPALARAVDYAVAYAAHGWPVLPIKPGEKLPATKLVHRGFLDATTDREVIERWWSRMPGAGIGIAVGMAGLVAVDIDPRNGGDVSALPFDTAGTLHAQTGGGGEHILYRVPQGFEPISWIAKGIDVKWNGYIVVEPTVHPSGRAYAFVDWDVLSGVVPEIAEAPPELLRRIGSVAEAVSAGAEILTPEQVADLRATLATISSDDRDRWISVGWALSTVAEHGFAIWDEWSQRSPKYDAADARRVWASFDPAKLKRPEMHWRWIFKNAEDMGGRNVSTRARRARSQDEPPPPPSDEPPAESRAQGGEGARERAPRKRKPLDLGRFHELMEHFVLIYSTDTAYDGRTRRIVRVANLRIAFGADVVKLWLADPERRMILPEQLVFDPGGDGGDECINLFDGLAMEPAEGDPAPILELLSHLCADSASTDAGVDTVVKWVLDWLAYPLQNPGAKMASALVFHGGQGAGKNLFFEAVASIYGKYGLVVGQDQLEDKFNDWASQKLFLIGDEVVAKAELYHQKNKLKSFITGDTIQINAKMLPLRTEKNHVNVVFLSNEQQPLALEPDDRRYMVVYTPPRGEESLYQRVGAFLKAGGAARLLRILLDRDLGDFGPHTRPIMTRAKADLIELGLKPPERFVREWLGGYLPLPLQVCASEQLYRAFRHWCQAAGERFPPPQVVFSKALDKAARGKLRAKVIKLDAAERGKLATRMWVPDGCAPPEGVTAGQWATDAVGEFERVLRVFCRGPGDDE